MRFLFIVDINILAKRKKVYEKRKDLLSDVYQRDIIKTTK